MSTQTLETLTIPLRNHTNDIMIDWTNADLVAIAWTYRKGSNDVFNPRYGTLHRIIAARKYQRELTNADVVIFVNGDRFDMRDQNICLMSRKAFNQKMREQRITARAIVQRTYITRLVYLPHSGDWRVLKDGSTHPTEAAAIKHLEAIS